MTWPTGTRIDDLDVDDDPVEALGCIWKCLSSGSTSSVLRIILPWGQTIKSTVRERITKTWYNPNNINQYVNFWAIGCSSSGTYGIANVNYSSPTLQIDRIIAEHSPAGDVPAHNRYGVFLEIHISGAGTGNLKLNWGGDLLETKTGIRAGNYAYTYNLPPGAHSICADLFNIV